MLAASQCGWVSSSSPSLVSPWQESQKQYELEYQRRATNLDKCMAELWRMERARDKNVREMKVSSDCREGSWQKNWMVFFEVRADF